jgi:hypothetical protein
MSDPVADFLSRCPSDAAEAEVNQLRRGEIARLADLAASYWHSVALAADRGEVLTVIIHCKQIVATTKTALAVVKELDSGDAP